MDKGARVDLDYGTAARLGTASDTPVHVMVPEWLHLYHYCTSG